MYVKLLTPYFISIKIYVLIQRCFTLNEYYIVAVDYF